MIKLYYTFSTPDSKDFIKKSLFLFSGKNDFVIKRTENGKPYTDGNIYFSDLDSRNKLYKLDLISGKQDELDTVYVTRMYSKGNKLIYFDDVSNTEGSIVLK